VCAFRIITNHSLGNRDFGEQLRIGIFGEGGTGKSRLIQAIEAWFVLLHRRQELVITTMTGTAAVKIGGTTLHSVIGIAVTEVDGQNRSLSPDKLALWTERQ
jgi:hypothetical protein